MPAASLAGVGPMPAASLAGVGPMRGRDEVAIEDTRMPWHEPARAGDDSAAGDNGDDGKDGDSDEDERHTAALAAAATAASAATAGAAAAIAAAAAAMERLSGPPSPPLAPAVMAGFCDPLAQLQTGGIELGVGAARVSGEGGVGGGASIAREMGDGRGSYQMELSAATADEAGYALVATAAVAAPTTAAATATTATTATAAAPAVAVAVAATAAAVAAACESAEAGGHRAPSATAVVATPATGLEQSAHDLARDLARELKRDALRAHALRSVVRSVAVRGPAARLHSAMAAWRLNALAASWDAAARVDCCTVERRRLLERQLVTASDRSCRRALREWHSTLVVASFSACAQQLASASTRAAATDRAHAVALLRRTDHHAHRAALRHALGQWQTTLRSLEAASAMEAHARLEALRPQLLEAVDQASATNHQSAQREAQLRAALQHCEESWRQAALQHESHLTEVQARAALERAQGVETSDALCRAAAAEAASLREVARRERAARAREMRALSHWCAALLVRSSLCARACAAARGALSEWRAACACLPWLVALADATEPHHPHHPHSASPRPPRPRTTGSSIDVGGGSDAFRSATSSPPPVAGSASDGFRSAASSPPPPPRVVAEPPQSPLITQPEPASPITPTRLLGSASRLATRIMRSARPSEPERGGAALEAEPEARGEGAAAAPHGHAHIDPSVTRPGSANSIEWRAVSSDGEGA